MKNAPVYLNGGGIEYVNAQVSFRGDAYAILYDGTETLTFTASVSGNYSFYVHDEVFNVTKIIDITVTGGDTTKPTLSLESARGTSRNATTLNFKSDVFMWQ